MFNINVSYEISAALVISRLSCINENVQKKASVGLFSDFRDFSWQERELLQNRGFREQLIQAPPSNGPTSKRKNALCSAGGGKMKRPIPSPAGAQLPAAPYS